MEAARRPRLRLSRRRPPAEDGAPGGRPPPPPEAGGGETERLWELLLRAVSAESSADGEPLPPFPGQEPEPQRAASPEAFTVGGETFSWLPLPPAPCRADPAPRPPAPAAPRTPQRPAAAGAPALRSCPLCQVDFAPGLTQLDLDGHLAQCLAESVEDVACAFQRRLPAARTLPGMNRKDRRPGRPGKCGNSKPSPQPPWGRPRRLP